MTAAKRYDNNRDIPKLDLLSALLLAMQETLLLCHRANRAQRRRIENDLNLAEAAELAIRAKYANAVLQWNDLERRAAAHGVWFSPTAEAHHRSAILDYVDDPRQPTHLTAMHATWFMGCGRDGRSTVAMTHAVNQAAFQIAARDLFRRGHSSEWYTRERAAWGTAEWHRYEADRWLELDEQRCAMTRARTHFKQRSPVPK